jgi:hypothetical protein
MSGEEFQPASTPCPPSERDARQATVEELSRWLQEQSAGDGLLTLRGCQRPDFLATPLHTSSTIELHGELGDYCVGGLRGAEVRIHGPAGHGLACGMESGTLTLNGAAGDCLLAFGHGGTVCVRGSAGRRAACGMDGAELVVTGDVGAEAGYRMRSGLLLVLGDAGPMLGAGMGGGTLLVAGSIASSASAIEEDRLRDADRLRMSLLLLKVGLEVKPSKLRVFRSVHAP